VSRSPDLSVCIPSLCRADLLRPCLRSVYDQTTGVAFEVVVVDNSERPRATDWLRAEFPRVRVISNERNAGFSRSCNQSMRASLGRFVLLLNDDTLVLDRALEKMVRFLHAHPGVGAVGPRMYLDESKRALQFSRGRAFPTPWRVFTSDLVCYSGMRKLFPRLVRPLLVMDTDLGTSGPAEHLNGACLMIRRATLEAVGDLDEDYSPAFIEETDWCFRARRSGWTMYHLAEAEIVHFGGGTIPQDDPRRAELFEEHLRLFLRKHFGRTVVQRRIVFAHMSAPLRAMHREVQRLRTSPARSGAT
jgi:hypothetical protein